MRQKVAAVIDSAMKRFVHSLAIAVCLVLAGCNPPRTYYFQHTSYNPPPEPAVDERGRPLSRAELLADGRWVKKVDIRSEPWGARIMVNGFYAGETPMFVSIPCSPSGRVTRPTRIRLIPNEAGGRVHGVFFPAGSSIPSRLYFSGTESARN